MAEYIEREAAVKAFHDKYGALCSQDALFAILMTLKDVPAADVAPVVHGRWLPTKDDNKKRCSNCDVIHLIAQYPHGEANYCPNCGAKMEGDT